MGLSCNETQRRSTHEAAEGDRLGAGCGTDDR